MKFPHRGHDVCGVAASELAAEFVIKSFTLSSHYPPSLQ